MYDHTPITIRDLKITDISSALNIAFAELGSDYLTEQDFLDALNTDGGFCKISITDNIVSGFSICKIFGPDKIDEMLALPNSDERNALSVHKTIGLLDSVAVAQEIKGKGVGSELISACCKELAARGADVLCAMAWKDVNGNANISDLLKKTGMSPSIEIRGYWNRFVTSPDGHDCPICGRPCRCSAVLYMKHIR